MSRKALAVVSVVAAVILVYREAASGYFFEDDFQWLAGTLTYRPSSVFSLFDRSHFYRPVIELYFWSATRLFGGSPELFHLVNVALHAANGVLLFFLARLIAGSDRFGFVAALFFVVMPGYVEAVAWVGALAEPIGAFFGCFAVSALLMYRRRGPALWRVLSVTAFLLALLTHESSVVFLPILVLADWAADDRKTLVPRSRTAWGDAARLYGPYVLVAALYVVPDVWINQQSYLVTEGHYRVGFHAIRNGLDYVVSLYVGKRNLASYAMIAFALPLLLVFGTRRARLAIWWIILALLPFVFFTWGNTSRYLYLPSMGFAMLLAEGVEWLDRFLARRVAPQPRLAFVCLVTAATAIRFSAFASEGVTNFSERTQAYRRYVEDFRRAHPQLAPHSVVFIDPRDDEILKHRYLEGLIRWEYRDPTIQVRIRSPRLSDPS